MFWYKGTLSRSQKASVFTRIVKILEIFIIVNAVMLVLSGIMLAMWYQPAPERAYQSVYFIKNCVYFGDFLLSLHRFSTHLIIFAMLLHMIVSLQSDNKKQWISGVFLLYIAILFLYTGYLLRWDFEGYYSVKGAALIMGDTIFVGEFLKKIILSGEDITYLTLSRFYFYHIFILPLIFFSLIYLHIKVTLKNISLKENIGIFLSLSGFVIFSSVLYTYEISEEISEGAEKIKPPWMFLWAYTIDYTMGNLSPKLNFITGTVVAAVAIYFLLIPYIKEIFGGKFVNRCTYILLFVLAGMSLYAHIFL